MHNSVKLVSRATGVVAAAGALAMLGFAVSSYTAQASSHREAPAIASDPAVDLTDVYAWRDKTNPRMVNLVMNTSPAQAPASGPNWYPFADGARYEMHIDNDGDAVHDITYRWVFSSKYQSQDTFLYNTGEVTGLQDENLNYRQYYKLTRITWKDNGKKNNSKVLVKHGQVAPANVGATSMPSYGKLATKAIKEKSGYKAFAGPRDDPFYVDLGGVFDLLSLRGDEAEDGLAGLNVNAIALKAPIKKLTKDTKVAGDTSEPVLGVWATTARQKTTVLKPEGEENTKGAFVQVSRLGQPLVNELVIALEDKDKFNAAKPAGDTQFANYVANPEVPTLLNAIHGIDVPAQGDFGSDDARNDLVAIFLTGVSGINQPANVVASEQLRLNVSIAPADGADRLGVIAGDNAGFPNGRRLGDDVTDIALRAMAGILHDTLTGSGFEYTAGALSDSINSNDEDFNSKFPYMAAPHTAVQ